MYSFIHELYFGNLNPQARQFNPHSSYAKAPQITVENEEKLSQALSGEALKLFLAYANAWAEVLGESVTETFSEGFRMGAHCALDVFSPKEGTFRPLG